MASAEENMAKRLRVARVDEFQAGKPILVPFGRHGIGVYKLGDSFCAILDFCPHEGIKICRGHLEGLFCANAVGEFSHQRDGEILVCPWHGWQFDLRTGGSLHDPACRLRTFPTEVVEETVYVLV